MPATRSKSRLVSRLGDTDEALETQTKPLSLIDALPSELLSHVLTSIDDARAFLHAAASCKAIQALELQSHAEQWHRLTLSKWPAADSHGIMAKMTWKARYKFCLHQTDPYRAVERGQLLTAAQLNERFEFFIQLGSCPHAWSEVDAGEKPCVALQMKLNLNGSLVPVVTPGDAPPKVLLDEDGGPARGRHHHRTYGIEISVRRVADGAVATLMEGHADTIETDEGTLWVFQGASQFERMYSRRNNQGDFLGFDRMSASHRNNDVSDYMACWFEVLPELDAQGEIIMTKPAIIESAHVEIAGDSDGLVLQLKDWSKLLTGRHLVRWDLYE